MRRRHLVLFVRAPRLGRGKRRLARDIGDVACAAFERRMIALLLRRLGGDPRWRTRLAVTPDGATSEARLWRRGVPAFGQGGGDLGRRMRRALAACPAGPAVLVGGDIPALAARHIENAFRILCRCDLVLGPARDGGFWLLGARRPRQLPPSFRGVRWSSPFALEDTLAALPRGLRVGYADTLDDIDDAAAYRRLAPRRGF